MATVIRLKRGGRTHAPYYRVVVMDSRTRTRGREVDIIGYYHPQGRPEPVSKVDAQKALYWLSKGAQPSDTVRKILSTKGIWSAFKQGTPLPVEAQEETLPETPEAIDAEAAAVPVAEDAPADVEAEAEVEADAEAEEPTPADDATQ